jgi:hypothetical protein
MSPHLSQPDAPHCCPSQPHVPQPYSHAATPLPAACTLQTHMLCCHTSPSQMHPIVVHLAVAHAMLPPPSSHTGPVTACLAAAWPPPLQLHLPLPHALQLHGPRRPPYSRTCHIAACLAAAWPHCCLPRSHTHYCPPSQPHTPCCCAPCHCMSHVAPLTAIHAMSPCTSQLHGHIAASLTAAHVTAPHHSHTCPIIAHLTASRATSLPSQLHSVIICIAAAQAMLVPPSQLHRLCRHTPCSCMHHIAAPYSVGTWAYWLYL